MTEGSRMPVAKRLVVAAVIAVVAVGPTWLLCQLAFDLTVEATAQVSALVFSVVAFLAAVAATGGERPSESPTRPTALRPATNIGPRNVRFTGRKQELVALRQRLMSGGTVVVQALLGLGGVGKSALALEYAHRFADKYPIRWWVDAERANLIGEELAGLAVAAGWVSPGADSTTALAEVRQRLAQDGRWLVIFDNAQDPEELRAWLNLGKGHILVTSRKSGWAQLATAVEVNVFSRPESIDFLRAAVPRLTEKEADEIALRTGDLPLALAHAAGVLADGSVSSRHFLDELGQHADAVLSERPHDYPVPLAAAIRVAVQRLSEHDEAGLQLLRLCAVMAPDPVPIDLLFPTAEDVLDEPLATVATTRTEVHTRAVRLRDLGLARLSADGLAVHRLTQAVLRDQMDAKQRESARDQVERLLVTAAPPGSDDPTHWPTWARLLPHILALDLASSRLDEMREVATDAVLYLLNRGEPEAASAMADPLVEAWHARYGEADMIALRAATHLSRALLETGQSEEALDLIDGVYEHYRGLLGENDVATLAAATGYAACLRAAGRLSEALALDQDTRERKRRVLDGGDDNPRTLVSANGLAADLRQLGRLEEAEALDRDTWNRKRRVLPEGHPSTLNSAANLAADLRALRRIGEAKELEEATFAGLRHVLGDSHPLTLASARNLAADYRALGDKKGAATMTDYLDEHPALSPRSGPEATPWSFVRA